MESGIFARSRLALYLGERMKRQGVLVIPAYEEVERLPHFLVSLREAGFLERTGWRTVVVDDGSSEASRQALRLQSAARGLEAGREYDWIPLEKNLGKGGAVYAGWDQVAASCEILGLVDADGAVPAREVVRLATMAEANPEQALFASRVKMLGHHVERSLTRHLTGRIFASLVGTLIEPGVYDSQCGLKMVPAKAYSRIRRVLEERRFVFDVELLAGLLRGGVPVREVPIDWKDVAGSKVRLGRDSWRMAWGIWQIRRRMRFWEERDGVLTRNDVKK